MRARSPAVRRGPRAGSGLRADAPAAAGDGRAEDWTGADGGCTRRAVSGRALLALGAVFAASRLAYLAAGVRFDMVTRHPGEYLWQLLGPGLLQHHLLVSVWNLDSQPPLFNLAVGLLLKLPIAFQQPVAAVTFLAVGFAIVLCAYALMVELAVPPWLAFSVAVFVIVDPAYVLYENWLSYAYPTAGLLVVSAWCLSRYLSSRAARWGAAFFAGVALVVLTNSSYQVVWLAAAVLIAVAARGSWRAALPVAVVPLVVVAGWVVKDAVQFGTPTTSSWLGMNLAKTTLLTDFLDQADIARLVHHRVLTPIATTSPFEPPADYVPRYASLPHTGVAALDAPSFDGGRIPNFNNLVYVAVSKQFLHDDLAFVRARPAKYARAVADAVKVWTVPPDEYFAVSANRARIASWSNLFDRVAEVRPADDPASIVVARYYTGDRPPWSQLSLLTIAVDVACLVGLPIVVLRGWRRERVRAGTSLFVWTTICYAFTVTSLVELGENQRFAMELGPLPLVGAAVVLSALLRREPTAPGTTRTDSTRSPTTVTSTAVHP